MTAHIHWDVAEELRAQVGKVSDESVENAVVEALREGQREGLALSVVFVTDEALKGLHGRFLDDNSPTDVMTFDLGDEEDGGPAGELYVSVEAALRCAPTYSWPVENELLLYVVHGTLHLCGYDDHDEEERRAMRLAEARVLQRLGHSIDHERHEQQ